MSETCEYNTCMRLKDMLPFYPIRVLTHQLNLKTCIIILLNKNIDT